VRNTDLIRWISAPATLCLLVAGTAQASQLQHFKTFSNVDFRAFGLGGMRNLGSGPLNVTGLSGTVKKAYLYWHGPTNSSTNPNINANVMLNGIPIVGTNIGFSGDNNWLATNSQAYRADVTTIVAPIGNGSYSLSGFAAGPLPQNPNNTTGVSLVVIYDNGNASDNRDIVIYQGNDSNCTANDCPSQPQYDPPGSWTAQVSGFQYVAGTVSLQFHVADGQLYDENSLKVNGFTIAPPPSVFDGLSVPSAGGPLPECNVIPPDPDCFGSLWDIKTWDITSYLSPGAVSLSVTGMQYDFNLGLTRFRRHLMKGGYDVEHEGARG
jgi:hypothetical protein